MQYHAIRLRTLARTGPSPSGRTSRWSCLDPAMADGMLCISIFSMHKGREQHAADARICSSPRPRVRDFKVTPRTTFKLPLPDTANRHRRSNAAPALSSSMQPTKLKYCVPLAPTSAPTSATHHALLCACIRILARRENDTPPVSSSLAPS